MTQKLDDNFLCSVSSICSIITIGEKGIHYPWRICSNCGNNVENIPERCPHCNAKVWGFNDKYIRKKKVVFIEGGCYEVDISK